MHLVRHVLGIATVFSFTLIGCSGGSDDDMPDTIVDGKQDSWGSPTSFGTLFQGIWQYGEIDPDARMKHAAYTFTLDGNAAVTLTTHRPPFEEHSIDLGATMIYLYKQREAGTFRRIAASEAIEDYGTLTKQLGAGTYRVIIKAEDARQGGEFMVKLGCDGAGCADGPQCLIPADYFTMHETKRGALSFRSRDVLRPGANIGSSAEAQLIAAAQESAHEVSTVAEAFEAADGNEINRDWYVDQLAGRMVWAFEYGAGDNSYGAIFVGGDPMPVATIGDGDIGHCTIFAQTCVFGRLSGEAQYMPDMTMIGDEEYTKPSEVPAAFAGQIRAAATNGGALPTLAQAFEHADESTFSVRTYRHADGRELVGVEFSAGDTSVGAFFPKGSTTKVARVSDQDIVDCTAF